MISTLSLVNDCLGLLGELPINDLDAFHPVVPRALSTLSTENSTVQATQWYFNNERVTLAPQTSGLIVLPTDTLSVDSLAATPRVTMRKGLLYNLDDATTKFTKDVKVKLHREVAFDDLPMLPRAYIAACTRLTFQANIDGDPAKTVLLREAKQHRYLELSAEHIRMEKTNMLSRPIVALRLARIRGARNMLRGF